MMKNITKTMISLILACLIITACAPAPAYQAITPADAREVLKNDSGAILLDVRTQAEYEELRIPGSILLPVDEIASGAETLLPDKNAAILVYCRSGNRSRTASMQLLGMGYTRVFDLGGIINWPYETESGK